MKLGTAELILNGDNAHRMEITVCLRTLLGTIAGELQMDRVFGVDLSALDQPLPIAEAMLSADMIDKIRIYEPRVQVEQVSFAAGIDGLLIPKVVCSIV